MTEFYVIMFLVVAIFTTLTFIATVKLAPPQYTKYPNLNYKTGRDIFYDVYWEDIDDRYVGDGIM